MIDKSFGGNVRFKFVIQCKDGRYKYAINELVHEDRQYKVDYSGGNLENEKPECGTLLMAKGGWKKIKLETDEHLQQFIHDLKVAMQSDNENDNW